jgi:hypothetical protein
MTLNSNPPALTTEQKNRIYAVLAVGCDRETAANYIGCSTADLHHAMQQDAEFAAEVRRTEAGSELTHMRTVHKAGEEPKNWRASVWWLEMHAANRFKARTIGEVTTRQLDEFVNVLTSIVCEEVESEEDRERVTRRMEDAVRELDDIVRANRFALASAHDAMRWRLRSVFDDDSDELDGPDEDLQAGD